MEAMTYAAVIAASYFLGACPFSVWVGRWLLGKDIRKYGDGNPGAVNVFRAGGRGAGVLALILDVGKGVPFVALAQSHFGFPEVMAFAVGLSSILGHAFSPLLRFRGGKAVAVSYGVLVALPHHDMLIAFAVFMFAGFLVLATEAWIVMLGPTGSLAYLLAAGAGLWQLLFMLAVFVVLGVKHLDDLKSVPRPQGRAIRWLQSRPWQT